MSSRKSPLSLICRASGWWARTPRRRLLWVLLSASTALREAEIDRQAERWAAVLHRLLGRLPDLLDWERLHRWAEETWPLQQGEVRRAETEEEPPGVVDSVRIVMAGVDRAVTEEVRQAVREIARGARVVLPREVIDAAIEQTHEYMIHVPDSIRADVVRLLRDVWHHEVGPRRQGAYGLEREIRRRWPEVSRRRARITAHTEWRRASQTALVEVYRRTGIDTVTWVTMSDAHVCPACSANGAKEPQPLAMPHYTGPRGLYIPRPPAHPLCRCSLIGHRGPLGKVPQEVPPPPPRYNHWEQQRYTSAFKALEDSGGDRAEAMRRVVGEWLPRAAPRDREQLVRVLTADYETQKFTNAELLVRAYAEQWSRESFVLMGKPALAQRLRDIVSADPNDAVPGLGRSALAWMTVRDLTMARGMCEVLSRAYISWRHYHAMPIVAYYPMTAANTFRRVGPMRGYWSIEEAMAAEPDVCYLRYHVYTLEHAPTERASWFTVRADSGGVWVNTGYPQQRIDDFDTMQLGVIKVRERRWERRDSSVKAPRHITSRVGKLKTLDEALAFGSDVDEWVQSLTAEVRDAYAAAHTEHAAIIDRIVRHEYSTAEEYAQLAQRANHLMTRMELLQSDTMYIVRQALAAARPLPRDLTPFLGDIVVDRELPEDIMEGIASVVPVDWLEAAAAGPQRPLTIMHPGVLRSGTSTRVWPTIDIAEDSPAETYVHEIGHAVEDTHPVGQLARAYMERLVQEYGEQAAAPLSELVPGAAYLSDERAFDHNRFPNPYMGKLYMHEGQVSSTEIISMGGSFLSARELLHHYTPPPLWDDRYAGIRQLIYALWFGG